MTIDKKIENGAMTITLEGKLDTQTSPELDKAIRESLDSIDSLTIDMIRLKHISSAGLRVLLSAHKALKSKGGMKLKNPNKTVLQILDFTGFDDIFTLE